MEMYLAKAFHWCFDRLQQVSREIMYDTGLERLLLFPVTNLRSKRMQSATEL
jgi:hypothetical protein